MKYNEMFTTKKRTDGTRFIAFDGPEYVRDFIRDVHFDYFGGCLPNDWIYEKISEAFEELENNGNDIDRCYYEPDCYYRELIEWMQEPYAHGFINEAMRDLGPFKDIYDQISVGQYQAIDAIYRAVNEFLNDNSADDEEDEDEDEDEENDIEIEA